MTRGAWMSTKAAMQLARHALSNMTACVLGLGISTLRHSVAASVPPVRNKMRSLP